MIRFYDTSALLAVDEVPEGFMTSSIVINELENIKTAKNKTEDVRFKARKLAHWLRDNPDKYDVMVATEDLYEVLNKYHLLETNDNLIAATAYIASLDNNIVFVTNDIVLSLVASKVMGLNVEVPSQENDFDYKGFAEIEMTDEEMAEFYSGGADLYDKYNLKENQYLVIKNNLGEAVDIRRYSGGKMMGLYSKKITSLAFGNDIKPKDIYQKMVIDSIMSNQITAISGQAGSGKTLLALAAAMSLIDEGKYDRLVVLFNPTSTRGAAQLGYYTGSMLEKAMQTSIGNILTTKLGDRYAVDCAVNNGKIKLVSMADQRGFSVNDGEILYITEAQNTNSDLIKLSLSRVSEGAKVIIEGDFRAQVDNVLFEGADNGLRRAIEVLAGSDIFGYVELQNVWRSKLCELVQKM